jgi:glycosyltransferase involved in cell wall biosynthesis
MRICDLTTLYIDGGQGGVNTYLLEKARYLSERADTSHLIIVPGARDEKREVFGSTLYTVKSRSLPSNPGHRVLASFRAVREILKAEAPDLVEVDCAYMLGQVARRALGAHVPVIGFYHVHLPTFIARPRFSRLGFLASTAEHFAWRYVDYCKQFCDRLVVTSPDMHTRLSKAGFGRLDTVALGVNLDLFRPAASRESSPDTHVLSVGRLSREKDLSTLIKAIKLLPEHYRLTIVGDGPVRDGLVADAAGHEHRITFLGAMPYGERLAEIYRSADIVAVPSPNETFNLTVLEGLASGVPVVAIEQGGPRDLVTPEVGELATPSDPVDFASKLEHLASRSISSEACRNLVEEHYSWQRTFDRLLDVYASSLEEKTQRATA